MRERMNPLDGLDAHSTLRAALSAALTMPKPAGEADDELREAA